MFESIENHIEFDLAVQAANEQKVSRTLAQKALRNTQSLKQIIPALNNYLAEPNHQYDLLVNKYGELNIIVKSASAVLYGPNPTQQVQQSVSHFVKQQSTTESTEQLVLVISGVGLGYHLLPLIKAVKPRFVIIYEPEIGLFQLSLKTADWFELVTFCHTTGIHLFLQLGDDTKALSEDLQELQMAFPEANKVLFFEHLDYPHLARAIYQYQQQNTSKLTATSPVFLSSAVFKVNAADCDDKITEEQHACFAKNMQWLQQNDETLFQRLVIYRWQQWQLTKVGKFIGLRDQCFRFYSTDYKHAVAGTLTTTDLSTAITFKYSLPEKLLQIPFAKLFTGINELQHNVNTASLATAFTVKERVLLGTADHNVILHALQNSEYLLVFQPDLDFLYASFFTVPWYHATAQVVICTEIKALEQHIITEYQIGNLDLINFYIDMPYYEQQLFAAYQLLRELVQNTNGKTNYVEKQLQSVSNCFTNSKQARYLVSTTPVLTEPVCIIGNGPSLDLHLTFLRENRQGLILISCGTALITLQRHGLVPDFHVELERGIDTLERLQQLPQNYLKQINLISPLDQHPQICKLFQTSLLVTLAGQECHSVLEYNFAPKQLLALHYAYYTVTNLAVDLALTIGCQNLFLIGIDFGFKYLTAHHAKASDYFTSKGTEIYDFELAHGAAYKVEANFGGHCLTVPPFDIARKLMSERIKLASTQKVYNCNDGAKIEGAIALTKPQITLQTKAVATALNTINNLFIKPQAFSTWSRPHHYIENSIRLVEQMLALSAEDPQHNLQHQLAMQRQILEETKLNQQHTCYQLFNGALRYIEMVAATLHYFAFPTTRFDTVRQAWLDYLANCLLQLKRESQKSAAPSH